ncbi:aldehyde dehydrogenase family protein [Kitasatospora aureofaciens]|uniref:aldehyde dehydrogenase family protein n=1 Tax=Kitasatospora aureofaciens TaxID=1894 RepID=UPI003F4D58B3
MQEHAEYGDQCVDGSWRPSGDYGSPVAVLNPATERVLTAVPAGGAADVDAAVTAARRAAPGWAATTRFLQYKSLQYCPARARGCRTALR